MMKIKNFIWRFILPWTVVAFGMLLDRYLTRLKIPTFVTGLLWVFSTIIFSASIWIASYPEQFFEIKRDWDMQIMVTGFKPVWTNQDRPDFSKYDPNKK